MTRQDLINHLATAAQTGTLVTPKHDPANLSTTYSSYRTVLSHELAQNLLNFLSSGDFKVEEFENLKMPRSPLYFSIEPSAGSTFSVPASGIAPNSPFATSALDRIVAVSGFQQGWHIFGESSFSIQQKISAGDLAYTAELT